MPERIDQRPDHVGGSFEWERAPECCGMLKDAIDEEKFIFVGNMVSEGDNIFYMMPVTPDGDFARSDGIVISHCPWCGTKISARKRYPLNP